MLLILISLFETADQTTNRVRHYKQNSSSARSSRNFRNEKIEYDQQEDFSLRTGRTRTQRRIAPESELSDRNMVSRHDSGHAASKVNKRNLHIETKLGEDGYNDTPRTAASTPSSTPSPQNGVRSNGDLRSPGQRKSPIVMSKDGADEAPVPDFITQTDRHGNASTPRSAAAVQNARIEHPSGVKPNLHVNRQGKLTEKQEVLDTCTEAFLDSFRSMCGCLFPDTEDGQPEQSSTAPAKTKDSILDCGRTRLLPEIHPEDTGKKCLVLDLDETLVHSSFRAVPGADFVIPVQVSFCRCTAFLSFDLELIHLSAFLFQIEDVVHFVYVMKRPGVDEFLVEMAKHYEIVIYTASLNKYADPLLDLLDPQKVIRSRLFRESCVFYEGNYVKDLSLLDRDLSQAIIIDNSPSSYSFHPENAIDCSSFIDDPRDRELNQIAAFLKGVKDVEDVRDVCHLWREWPNVDIAKQ